MGLRVLTTRGNILNSAYINYYRNKLTNYLAEKADMVQHREVIKEVASGVDRSWIYYVMLLVAGLIALLGLLTNSVAVVIGAMLISPLMGPIISSSLAFTIGDLTLARRAFRTIAVSVALTVAVSALVTLVSPLKEPTAEILARVRPNILDLFVAALSGVAGAVALCTKRNYLVTATGVAVATAVIPPLSVVGYGLGTWQPMLALGGFLLFFTNFVAIVLTSDLVFFILGFRTSLAESPKYSHRTRLLIVTVLLSLISVPLVYTLASDVARIKDKKRVERVLKRHLNRETASRLTGYEQLPRGEELLVRATVNTVRFIERPAQREIEQELAKWLKRPVRMELEQLIVASGQELNGGEEEPGMAPEKRERPAELAGRVARVVAKAEQELGEALAPFPVSGTRIAFAGAGGALAVSAVVRRDYPLSEDERLILTRQLARALEHPVTLAIESQPLFSPLRFAADGNLAPETQKELEVLKRLPDAATGYRFRVVAPRGNQREAGSLVRYLTGELALPEASLSTGRASGKTTVVTLSVLRQSKRGDI